MASHLRRTTQEAQASITSTEFLKWIWFLDWKDTEEFNRQDFYLAQIAAEIERGPVKNPSAVTIQKKLLKFSTQAEAPSKQGRIQTSKNFWLALAGVERGRRRKKKRNPTKLKASKE